MSLLSLLNPRVQAPFTQQLSAASAILALQFNGWECELPDAKPDPSNASIAEIVGGLWRITDLPILVQSEHAAMLRKAGVSVWAEYASSSKVHVPTHAYLQWAAKHIHSRGWNSRVIIVCHPDHSWRIACLAQYYGIDPIIPASCKSVPYANAKLPGDQRWVRTRKQFLWWEYCIARPGTLALWTLRKL